MDLAFSTQSKALQKRTKPSSSKQAPMMDVLKSTPSNRD